MDRSDSWWGQVGTPVVALAAATLFAGTFYRAQYRTPRPPVEPLPWSPEARQDAADSLLTQDPLEAAYRRYSEARAGSEKPPREALGGAFEPVALRGELSKQDTQCAHCRSQDGEHRTRTLVLPVSVRGGAWPEDREMRVRARHAVLCALLEEQRYVAVETRRMRFFEHADEGDPIVVPYEWFRRSNQGLAEPQPGAHQEWCRVLVLWLDANALGEGPFARLRSVLDTLGLDEPPAGLEVCWIGPHNSDGLAKLLDECPGARPFTPREDADLTTEELDGHLRILSPYSTAVMPVFEERVPGADGELGEAVHHTALKGEGWVLERTIGFDDALARTLVTELELRLPDLMPLEPAWKREGLSGWRGFAIGLLRGTFLIPPREETVRVAVVSEQDTDYGRYWHHTLEATRDLLHAQALEGGATSYLGGLEFERIHYLGGIDGRGPGAGGAQAEDVPYPLGASQIDYLRRLQTALDASERFDAIVVLGSNVYDTLMILEALHAQFKDTLFLTVDLDARLFDRKHHGFMRNVVVASHLPLSVGATDVPSPRFRDLYQHSTYRTARSLLEKGVVARHPFSGAPRVYEIGLGRAIELNTTERPQPRGFAPANGAGAVAMRLAVMLDRTWSALTNRVLAAEESESDGAADTQAGTALDVATVFAALLLLGLVLVAAQPAAPGKRESASAGANRRRMRVVLASSTAVAGFAFVLLFWVAMDVSRSEPIEPLVPFEGVSVWPAIAVRAACATFCLGALWAIPRRLRRAHQRIGMEYMLFVERGPSTAHARVPLDWLIGDTWLMRALRRLRRAPAPGTLRANEVWAGVGRWIGDGSGRALRLALYVLLFHYAVGLFYRLSPVSAPVRGEFAYLMERLSILAVVWPFLALVFLVLENTFLCSRLVLRLTEEDSTSFPSWTLAAEMRRTRLPRRYAERRLRVRLLRSLTRPVEGLVWYPVIAVCLMVAARSSVIDGYGWPAVLVGTFALFFVLLLLCEINIRRVAQDQKRDALDYFRGQILHCARNGVLSKRLGIVMEEIERLSGGAFSPLTQHAIVRSAFLPLIAYVTTQAAGPTGLWGLLRGG